MRCGDSGEWTRQLTCSYECGHNCVPGKVGIPTLLQGAVKFS